MKLNFKVDVKGFDKGKLLIKDKTKRVLMKSMFKMEELAVQKAPVDRGNLKGKITVFPQILANQYVLVSKAPYSAAMEFGTRPFYAPIEPLKGWARRKLGDESAAYAVRAKIAKEGITAQPFMRPAFYEVVNYWFPSFAKKEFSN